MRKQLMTFLLSAGLLAGVWAICDEWKSRAERAACPSRGKLVMLGGRVLHLRDMGRATAGPTVLLEAGLEGTSASWSLIQPEVATFTRVVAYDRAGLGWSEVSSSPRDAQHIAKELHSLLQSAGIDPPYVLVGHSMGGFHVRVFRELYPSEVVGMVLVDPCHPDQMARHPLLKRELQAYFAQTDRAYLLARLGVLRLLPRSPADAGDLPASEVGAIELFKRSRRQLETTRAEMRAWDQSVDQVRRSGGLASLPLVVLSSTIPVDPSMPVWQEMCREQAGLSSRGRYQAVPGADHMGLLTSREYSRWTVHAIRDVVAATLVNAVHP